MHLPQSCSHSSSYLVDSRHQNLYRQVWCVVSSQVEIRIVLKLLSALKVRCNLACTSTCQNFRPVGSAKGAIDIRDFVFWGPLLHPFANGVCGVVSFLNTRVVPWCYKWRKDAIAFGCMHHTNAGCDLWIREAPLVLLGHTQNAAPGEVSSESTVRTHWGVMEESRQPKSSCGAHRHSVTTCGSSPTKETTNGIYF